MNNFEGYLWKRAPRSHDKDKNSLRRMFTPSINSLYKKRYFSLSPETFVLTYYSDAKKSEALGLILSSLHLIDLSTLPSPFSLLPPLLLPS
jgi:hypothetical protein